MLSPPVWECDFGVYSIPAVYAVVLCRVEDIPLHNTLLHFILSLIVIFGLVPVSPTAAGTVLVCFHCLGVHRPGWDLMSVFGGAPRHHLHHVFYLNMYHNFY